MLFIDNFFLKFNIGGRIFICFRVIFELSDCFEVDVLILVRKMIWVLWVEDGKGGSLNGKD